MFSCLPKRNGNMRHVLVKYELSRKDCLKRSHGLEILPTGERMTSPPKRLTNGAYMICLAICGNGQRIKLEISPRTMKEMG